MRLSCRCCRSRRSPACRSRPAVPRPGRPGPRGNGQATVGVVRVEDVRQVVRRVDPGVDDRARRREVEGAPGDVLADDVAVARIRQVTGGLDAAERGVAGRAVVGEVVLGDHVVVVLLGRLLQVGVGRERRQSVLAADLVDEAQRGGLDDGDVGRVGRQVRVRAGRGAGDGRRRGRRRRGGRAGRRLRARGRRRARHAVMRLARGGLRRGVTPGAGRRVTHRGLARLGLGVAAGGGDAAGSVGASTWPPRRPAVQ